MNQILRSGLFIIIMALASAHTWSEEAEQGGETTNTETEQGSDNDKAKQPNSRDKGTVGDIFRPSEEISEDFAVSFPVDI